MNTIGHNFIAGTRSAAGDKVLKSLNASTGEALTFDFFQATEQEVNQAVEAAHTAFKTYRHTSPEQRALFLESIADELDALGEDFLNTISQETALPIARLQGERGRTSGQMRLFAKVLRRGDFLGARIDTALPERQPLPRPDLRQIKIGVGPVAVFGASNFPLAFSTAGGDTASALAAGCSVVVKAHSGHMATADYVAQAIERAVEKTGMPKGVFNMIYGNAVGALLVKHPLIQAVGFTGSLKGGRALCDMAAARPQPIPVFAEMSSINPMLMLPEALKNRGDQIAQELADSVVLGCGQFCTNPGLILGIKSPEYTRLIEQLSEIMANKPAQTMLNAGTLNSYVSGLSHLSEHSGIQHLAGQEQQGEQALAQLFKAEVELLLAGDQLLQEEIFGPTTIVIEVEDKAQLLQALSSMNGQLTASLIADESDLVEFADVVPVLEEKAGRLLLNGYPTGVEVCDAMVHGGPYPATSDARGTSVGTLAIDRYLRPVCYQNYPQSLLPEALRDENPLNLLRLVNGEMTQNRI
ncbi:aldehyde dehydrogenase (NADP(+)) [Acinetobacter lwoffii]|jgi:alpha-ketoglutaric semialdehyde dehydrogenase|uniref:aldehyde dehydrogenase (NADP(+)) n=1 Tax=Acinetobacter lwoffii TaxID=28090 RepID=UPI001C5B1A8B|nr:aldehyde dehydrogenase (NADP(+)) [Acinetobacter lwoffii]QXX87734.1 aldehyde dehydrogenase (NADP(+)) [Acinetobacter lwoffii]QXX87748.1 aldehyde dehydrogenase (NADP(+)) [Acinetobacter lwoffii]